jgi:hypothetical protein
MVEGSLKTRRSRVFTQPGSEAACRGHRSIFSLAPCYVALAGRAGQKQTSTNERTLLLAVNGPMSEIFFSLRDNGFERRHI